MIPPLSPNITIFSRQDGSINLPYQKGIGTILPDYRLSNPSSPNRKVGVGSLLLFTPNQRKTWWNFLPIPFFQHIYANIDTVGRARPIVPPIINYPLDKIKILILSERSQQHDSSPPPTKNYLFNLFPTEKKVPIVYPPAHSPTHIFSPIFSEKMSMVALKVENLTRRRLNKMSSHIHKFINST